MPDMSYSMYDTAEFDNAADVDFELFQSRQGSTSARTKNVTNSRGDGSLPANEGFRIDKIIIMIEPDVIRTEAELAWRDSYIEILINERSVFLVPLAMCAGHMQWQGEFHEAIATLVDSIGLVGDGYALELPLSIPGGTSFRVTLHQAIATAGAASVKCILKGMLSVPD